MLGRSRGDRRYTSSACLECRKRKIKCNDDRPRCSNCRVYNIDCVFGDDRRRTSSTLKTLGTLASRLDGLESLLTGQQTVEARKSSPLLGVDPSLQNSSNQKTGRSAEYAGVSSESPAGLQNASNPQIEGYYGAPDMDYWVQIAECPVFLDSVGTNLHDEGGATCNEIILSLSSGYDAEGAGRTDIDVPSPKRRRTEVPEGNLNTAIEATPFEIGITGHQTTSTGHDAQSESPMNDLTLQLASRLGQFQIAEDGQLRYYGATSNLHMIKHGLFSLFETSIRRVREHGDTALRQSGLEWAGDVAYEEHLTKLYFAWHNPLLSEVNQQVYLEGKNAHEAGHDTPYYSPTLANAIMAVGAAYSLRPHPGNQDDAAEFFCSRARILIDIEIDSPTVATVQALLLLSAHEAARGRDSRGWLYVGMAVQVVADLGLHLSVDPDQLGSESASESGQTAELRRNIFWATYTANTLWSSYSGRPSIMNNTQHNVADPQPLTSYKWEYYVDRVQQSTLSLNLCTANLVPMYMTRLATILGKISNVLYTGMPESATNARTFHAAVVGELKQWKESLPPSLLVDISQSLRDSEKTLYLPMVLQLHMQYHEAIILLHRPFITETRSAAISPFESLDAMQVCTESASEISRLVLLYRRQWGLQQINIQAVHVIMTAGIIHAYDCCVLSAPQSKAARGSLHICLQALGEVGQTFDSGNRGLQVVMSLMRDWQNEKFSMESVGSQSTATAAPLPAQ